MTILVTGAAGHLGEALVRTLRASGDSVRSLDLRPSPFVTNVGSIVDADVVAGCMRGVDVVLHAATLHKPHVATHKRQDFVDTNITGTLNLLEAATAAGCKAFVFTSTTSTFGDALRPPPGQPAAWITEDVTPEPKNIYGATKTAAEDLCRLFHRLHGLPCIVLRTSRFFPEKDDDEDVRGAFDDANVKANEFLFRRIDIADAVSAHLAAAERAPAIGFGRYIISATSPFARDDLAELRRDAPAALARRVPQYADVYTRFGWRMFPSIDRVYVNDRARTELGWRPRMDFAAVLKRLASGQEPLGDLAGEVGVKGYHGAAYADGIYPVSKT